MIKTTISTLLNSLVDMQASPACAAIKSILIDAEQTLLFLDISNAKKAEEIKRLREVYEAARRVLRYNGVDKAKVDKAVDELDTAIESVKSLDSGQEDDIN